eukprot:TRINITY_DN1531_c1_g1_i1.p1 TRINITY_DN1531_c1_g1~~TRINITY_DN1531_c1_g1_i1.p1  ORF type:complete len:387 (-),score=79.43 TRINITY_DN1531_c1_g1_i1:97-1257(-)
MPLNFPQWLYWFFNGHFEFNAAWLWFLPTLLVIGIFNAPLFLYAESRSRKYLLLSMLNWAVMVAALLVMGFSLALCGFVILGPAVAAATAGVVHFRPLWDHSWSPQRILANALVTATFIGSHIGIVLNFRYSDLAGTVKAVPASLLFYGFYTQGYFAQRLECDIDMEGSVEQAIVASSDQPDEESTEPRRLPVPTTSSSDEDHDSDEEEPSLGPSVFSAARRNRRVLICARIARVFLGFLTIFAMAIGAPNGEWEEELFPLYSASYKPGMRIGVNKFEESSFFAVAHIASTWAYVYMTVAYFAAYADHEMHPRMYEHASKSTMVTYIFHFVFAKMFTFWVIKAAGMTEGWWLLLDPILVFAFSIVGCFGVYMIFVRVPMLGALFGL